MSNHDEMGQRRARRVILNCQVFFFGEDDFEGEAHMIECSTAGCRLIADATMEVGRELQLSMFLEDLPWTLRIDRAVVRWVSGPEFGVEFLSIRSSIRARLRLVLMKLKEQITAFS
ncbi:hypothetical protein YTPLAS18_38870 [Nitrospira sp.]|nr:hypothetical protein YTPLAS18_38870 [Nitrospira sp.]